MGELTDKLIDTLNRLTVELATFSAETKEWKDAMNRRIELLELNWRESVKARANRNTIVLGWCGFAISCMSLVVVLIKSFTLR